MDIKILHLIEGAKAASGVTVIIDVFRAFSLESYMFAAGVECIYPIGQVEKAYKMKIKHPEWILAGERHGAILPGFDTGNGLVNVFFEFFSIISKYRITSRFDKKWEFQFFFQRGNRFAQRRSSNK